MSEVSGLFLASKDSSGLVSLGGRLGVRLF